MTAVSLSVDRGALLNQTTTVIGNQGFKVGTSAPGTGDVELRFNLQDANSVNLTREDVLNILNAMRWLLSNTNSNVAGGLITNVGV
jgi:hypothetical protein